MTFLELQKQLKQQRKFDKNPDNRNGRDHYEFDISGNNRHFDETVYRRALAVANKVVKHYFDSGELDTKKPAPKVTFSD